MHCFAYFDETMDCIGGYKLWRSENTVPIMQKQNMNGFARVLKVVICFIILTDLTRFY